MGQKIKSIGFNRILPSAVNFTELKKTEPYPSESTGETSDNGIQVETMIENTQLEELVVQMLYNLDIEEKCVFLYQLLRDMGYQIDHISLAKTLHISRSKYMDMLQNIRVKTFLMVKSQGVKNNSQTNHSPVG